MGGGDGCEWWGGVSHLVTWAVADATWGWPLKKSKDHFLKPWSLKLAKGNFIYLSWPKKIV